MYESRTNILIYFSKKNKKFIVLFSFCSVSVRLQPSLLITEGNYHQGLCVLPALLDSVVISSVSLHFHVIRFDFYVLH